MSTRKKQCPRHARVSAPDTEKGQICLPRDGLKKTIWNNFESPWEGPDETPDPLLLV